MGIRDIYHGPDDNRRPSRLWEQLHPRRAEAYWAAEQEKADLEDARIWAEEEAERQADARYREWADNEYHKSNPPKSVELDREIGRFSEQFPEVSHLEQEQRDFEEAAYARGPNWSFPQYEGPGFTEPPLHWKAPGQHKGWTFTTWALERGYAGERIDEINRQFPPDQAELQHAQQVEERIAEEYADWAHGYAAGQDPMAEPEETRYCGECGQAAGDWHDAGCRNDPAYSGFGWQVPERDQGDVRAQEPEAPGLLRIIPMEKAADSAWEYPRQREVRGEPDPYNPLHFPSYSYWPPGVEAAE